MPLFDPLLGGPHIEIFSLFSQEFIVGPFFHDGSVFHNQNIIRSGDSGEPVGDDDDGFIFHQFINSVLYSHLAFRIQGSGGLIQNNDGRVL